MNNMPLVNINEGKKLSLVALAMALVAPLQGSGINPEELFNQLSTHEGYKQVVYKDSKGIPTIGVGFNLNEKHNQEFLKKIGIDINEILNGKPLTDKQIRILYNYSLRIAYKNADELVSNFKQQPKEVKKILIDMSFNMGYNRFEKFQGMIRAVENGDYQKAALEMKFKNGVDGAVTPWYTQTKTRAVRLVGQMENVK